MGKRGRISNALLVIYILVFIGLSFTAYQSFDKEITGKAVASIQVNETSESGVNEWRMFGRFLNQTRYTEASGVSNLSEALVSSFTAGNNIDSSPAVANGFVYVGSDDRQLYQLNASNVSQKIANYSAGDAISSSPAVANGFVYVGSWDKQVYQLNASNVSQKIANYSTGGAVISSPAVANGFVYVGSNDKQIYQLNATNVRLLIANYSTGDNALFSPTVANGYVYVGSNDGNLYQLNASNVSKLIASYAIGNPSGDTVYPSHAVANGFVYVGSNNNRIYQLNASNISQLFASYNTVDDIDITAPAVANGYVYTGGFNGLLYQLNASNVSKLIASYNLGDNILASPSVTDKYVYVGSENLKFYQLNASNVSKFITSYSAGAGGFFFSSAAVVNGKVYVGSQNDKLYQFNEVDSTAPVIALISPANNSGSKTGNLTFNYNVNDASSITNCSFLLNGTINKTNISVTKDVTQNFTLTDLNSGNYNWSVRCVDSSNNVGNSANRTFAVAKATEFSGSTTDLSSVNVSNITNLVAENPDSGKINFSQNVDLSAGGDLDANVNISLNRVEINSTALTSLNKSAIITLYNLTFVSPRILKDGSICPSSICTQISYSGGTLVFNVSHFSVYSAEDTPSSTEEEVSSDSGSGCPPRYECSEWSACSAEGKHTRTCEDSLCGFPDKTETQNCVYEAPAPAPVVEEVKEEPLQESKVEEVLRKVADYNAWILFLVIGAIALLIIRDVLHNKAKKGSKKHSSKKKSSRKK